MTAEPDFPDSDGMTYSYQWYRASYQWYCTGELSSEISEPIPNENAETLEIVSDTVGTTYYFCVIEGIAEDVIAELREQGLTQADCGDLEKHAYSVNDRIADGQIRNMHVLAAV
jgi:hypothetical protein